MIFHLPVLLIILYASKEAVSKRAFIFAFGWGLFIDLLVGNTLGLLAVSYLFIALLIHVYKLRFRISLVTLLLFTVISQAVFYYARGFIG